MPFRFALLAPLGLALLAACQRPPAHPWPPEMLESFLRACRENAADAQCRCAADVLQDRFTLEQYQDFERQLAAGTVPKDMADAISGCAGR